MEGSSGSVKTEKVEKIDEPMKIQYIPIIGQVINIPITGNITIINPSIMQSEVLVPVNEPAGPSENGIIEKFVISNESPKSADVKMETDQEIATLEEK